MKTKEKTLQAWLALALQLIPSEIEGWHKINAHWMYAKGYNKAIRESVENINKFLKLYEK